jgi:hypothetical protein
MMPNPVFGVLFHCSGSQPRTLYQKLVESHTVRRSSGEHQSGEHQNASPAA